MNRLQNFFESGTPVIVMAAVVLLGGIATGFYKSHSAPEPEAPAAAPPAEPAVTPTPPAATH